MNPTGTDDPGPEGRAWPAPEVVDFVRDIPLYRPALDRGHFPVLEKPEIACGFPDNWMTPRLAAALAAGEAEYVLSTGTNHARMRLIRPPYFLLHSYYRLWSEHPAISATWRAGCQRVSLTTVLATEHVARVNARRRTGNPTPDPDPGPDQGPDQGPGPAAIEHLTLEERRLDERTVYLNRRLDPGRDWDRAEVVRILAEIRRVAAAHPEGAYHLDCSGYHLAHLVRHARALGLWDPARFPRPASIVHAYEYTPLTVRRYLRRHFDCPVVDLFGSTELGYLFHGDGEGRYHPHLADMSVELLPVAPGSGIHSLIVTSLRNPHMPLVRYRSGDCVRTEDGSADPTRIVSFCGREKELLAGPDGPVAHGDLDALVAEHAPGTFLARLDLPADDAPRGTRAVLRHTTFDGAPTPAGPADRLATAVGALIGRPTTLAHHEHLPIGPSGKYPWLRRTPRGDTA
ncbi:hypothetical protein ACN20G_33150 (plasmid) [Streptomyces sp. BI20]|uniref:hypothetical protein n=1 Tax=Streptomyces sp. BI20 TaxID=3403460 RepID=UPI003C78C4A4